MPSRETFYCTFSGRRFRLFAELPKSLFNSMMPFFFGAVEGTSEGSVVRGRLGVHPFVVIFLACYVMGASGMAGFLFWAAFTSDATSGVLWVLYGALVCILLGAAGIGMFAFGIKAGQAQEKAILRFLDTKLEATRTDIKEIS